jgi:hypothetical protein
VSSGLPKRSTHHFYRMLQSGELTREPTGGVQCGQEAHTGWVDLTVGGLSTLGGRTGGRSGGTAN